MAIRITRNEEGNCITFIGSTNPAYWNACLSAVINSEDADRIDIINDIRSSNSDDTQYEFYAVEYTAFADRDGNSFDSAQAAVDYINANANVVGVSDVGADLTDTVVNFRLDQTSTSIIMDNGSSFGVNTIKAIADVDGTIHIHAIGAGEPNGEDNPNEHKHFEKLAHTNVQINHVAATGGLNDVVNQLNELFTVGPFEAVVIADPYSTMVADVDGTTTTYNLVGSHAVDPVGNSIFGATQNTNYAGLKTVETIDQAGEYYTFDIRGEGQLGFGLIHTDQSYADGYYTGNATYANPANFATYNSQHGGWQWSHHFHLTPNGSWTQYGSNTGFVRGSGWYNWESQDEWLAGELVKVRCGIDTNGFIYVSTLQDDNTTWIVHARSSYPVPEGSEYHLGIKIGRNSSFVETVPKVHLLEEAAPTMYFRYIESPDNNYEWPLFATEEEANYYDANHQGTTGTGTSHTHTFADDPTNTTWYMPDTGNTMTGTAPPSGLWLQDFGGVTYTEITSLTNADLTPDQFSSTDYTFAEGTAVNIAIDPAGATWNTSVTISPSGSGLVYNTGSKVLQGTLSDVTTDTLYTVTVVRANSYGSSTGSFEIQATDVPVAPTLTTPWTKALDFSGNGEHLKQVDSSMYYSPLQMGGLAHTPGLGTRSQGETSDNSNSRPWAVAVVFKSDGYSGNQMIWNQGEGSTTNDDNIFMNVTAAGNIHLGWGRSGVGYNQCRLATNIDSSKWYGVAIAHNGVRLGGNNATAANLANCFDIRLMSSADSFASISSNLSTVANWTNTGVRMDRTVAGDFTVGGRGNGYSFRGKVASMVVTTLIGSGTFTGPAGYMPDSDQFKMMITDPIEWVDDYKKRLSANNGSGVFRKAAERYFTQPFLVPDLGAAQGCQVWLMGDGTSDSYSNGIRNHINPTDQNKTKIQLNSMVSNDIETVNIAGLT